VIAQRTLVSGRRKTSVVACPLLDDLLKRRSMTVTASR
jgi:hypothetical protein